MAANQREAGIIISYIGQFVRILTELIYTPVMLRLLGKSEYGLYQLVYSAVSSLSLLSLGFGASYMRFYSREKTDGNDGGIARLNGMYLLIFCMISVICVFCGMAMLRNIRVIFGNKLTDAEYATAKTLMALMIVNLTLTFPNSVFNCIVTSQEKFLFQKTLLLLQSLCNPFLTLPLLIMGYGSVGMVSVTTLLTLAVLLSNIFFCLKKLRAKFCFRELQFSLLSEMWNFTFYIFLNLIIDQVNWSVDKFLLGRLMGTVTVAVYGVAGQINSLYMIFSTAISDVFVPKVNRIVAETNDNHELTDLFIKIGRVQFMIMMLILSGFIFFGKVFIQFWVGEEYRAAYGTALLLIVPFTVPLIQNLGIEIQRAKNMHRTRSMVYFFMAVMNVIVSIPPIKIWGASGAACGTALSLAIGNGLFMNWYYHTKIGINIVHFWKSIASFIPALCVPILFGAVSMIIVSDSNFCIFIIFVFIYVLVYCSSMYFIGLNREEKSFIFGLYKRKK